MPRHEHVHENERPGVADLCAHSSLLGRSGKTMAWRLPQYEIPGTTAVLSSTRSQIMSCGACRKIPCETKPNPKPPRPRHATRRLQTSDESGTALWSHQRHFRPAIDVESAAIVCSEPSPHNRRSYLTLCGVGPACGSYMWTLPMFHCNGWCFPWTIARARPAPQNQTASWSVRRALLKMCDEARGRHWVLN